MLAPPPPQTELAHLPHQPARPTQYWGLQVTIDRSSLQRLFDQACASGPGGTLAIARTCTEHLGVGSAAVSVTSGHGTRTLLCATDEQARRLTDSQTTAGVGPSLDAITRGEPVLVPDLLDPSSATGTVPGSDPALRWLGFLDMAQQAGVRAVFSLPVRIGTLTLGALDLHRRQPGPLTSDETGAALLAADAVASCLLAQNYRQGDDDTVLPWPSADAGVVVHQATGMIGVQVGTSMAGALLLLRARAFHEGRLLSHVAQDVVDRRTRFSRERPQ